MDSKWSIGKEGAMPVGFGLSLAANEKAMEVFAGMSEAEKEATVEKSRQMHSKKEMKQFVKNLGESRDQFM